MRTLTNINVSNSNTNKNERNTILRESRMELDSYANMLVVRQYAYVLSDTGRTADVNAYNSQYEAMVIPIIDAAVYYDYSYSGQTYILVIRNALHVPATETRLIPPSVLTETGLRVSDTPKIHTDEHTVLDHSLYFDVSNFCIPLTLYGMFLYFLTIIPSIKTLQECAAIYFY